MCVTATPIIPVVNDAPDGWIQVTGLDVTALAQYDAVNSAVLTFDSMMSGPAQMGRILQVQVKEIIGSGTIQKKDLYVHLFSGTAPTTPTGNTAYDAPNTYWIATYLVRTEDYARLGALCEIATVNIPLAGANLNDGVVFRSASSATAGKVYAVVTAGEAIDYEATAELWVRVAIQEFTTTNAA